MSNVQRPPKSRRGGGGLNFSSQKRKPESDAELWESIKKEKLEDDLSAQHLLNHPPIVTTISKPSNKYHRTRVLLMSDTHGKVTLPEQIEEDAAVDVVIHTGDLSECGDIQDYRKTISLLGSMAAELKLVIPGNHDLTLDESFWSKHSTSSGSKLHSEARELWTSQSTQDAGIVLLEDGIHQFTLKSGAKLTVYASSATPQPPLIAEWAFGYPSNTDRYNLEGTGIWYGQSTATSQTELLAGAQIDVMMTHGPPKYILDSDPGSGESIGCAHLFRAIRRTKPKLHVFGHVHSGYGAEMARWKSHVEELPKDDDSDDGIKSRKVVEGCVDGAVRVVKDALICSQQTLFINAALMDDNGKLGRFPWLVEIDLSVGATNSPSPS